MRRLPPALSSIQNAFVIPAITYSLGISRFAMGCPNEGFFLAFQLSNRFSFLDGLFQKAQDILFLAYH